MIKRHSKSEIRLDFAKPKYKSTPVLLKPNSLIDPTKIIGQTEKKTFFYEKLDEGDYNFISEKNSEYLLFNKTVRTRSRPLLKNSFTRKKSQTTKNFRINSKRKKSKGIISQRKIVENRLENFFQKSELNEQSEFIINDKLMTPRQKEMYRTVGYNFWIDKASKQVEKKLAKKVHMKKVLGNKMYDFTWKRDKMETDIMASQRIVNTDIDDDDEDNPYLLDTAISESDAAIMKNLMKEKEEEELKNMRKDKKKTEGVFKKAKSLRDDGNITFIDNSEVMKVPKGVVSKHSHMNDFYTLAEFERKYPSYYADETTSEFIFSSGKESRDVYGIIQKRKQKVKEMSEYQKKLILEHKERSKREFSQFARKSIKPYQRRKRRRNWRRVRKAVIDKKGKVKTDLLIRSNKYVPKRLIDVYSPKRAMMMRPYKSYWMECVDRLLESDNCLEEENVGYYCVVLKRYLPRVFLGEDFEFLDEKDIEVMALCAEEQHKVEFDLRTEKIHKECRRKNWSKEKKKAGRFKSSKI